MTACPSHTDISRYIALIADGRYSDSYELNRESNTLSSKSQDLETTRLAVDMKVVIEQMREQVQNIE